MVPKELPGEAADSGVGSIDIHPINIIQEKMARRFG